MCLNPAFGYNWDREWLSQRHIDIGSNVCLCPSERPSIRMIAPATEIYLYFEFLLETTCLIYQELSSELSLNPPEVAPSGNMSVR